jgi:hypothetical protein
MPLHFLICLQSNPSDAEPKQKGTPEGLPVSTEGGDQACKYLEP